MAHTINPLTYAREKSGISLTDLSAKVGLSKQYLALVEAGCYPSINPAVIRWLREELGKEFEGGISVNQIDEWYRGFRINKRTEAWTGFSRHGVEILDKMPDLANYARNPKLYRKLFVEWRASYWISAHSFAKDMCIHPYSISRYERGAGRVGLPTDLHNLLIWMDKGVRRSSQLS